MTLAELKKTKSDLLLALQAARSLNNKKEARRLASQAAALEGQIAAELLAAGRAADAVVSLISEASCLRIAERHTESRRVAEKALSLGPAPQVCEWLHDFMATLDTDRRPAKVFEMGGVSIIGNEHLRRPQVEAYVAMHDHFAKSSEHAIVQLPVGAGKTGTMAIAPFSLSSGRVLVLAPNVEIAKTLHRNMNHAGPDSFWRKTRVLANGIGPTAAILDEKANIHDCDESDIVVTNIQQLVASDAKKWLVQLPPDYFGMVLIDEGHHNVAESWQETLRRFSGAKVVSFTATPLRSDGKRVEGKRIYHFPIADAIREGLVRDIAARRLEPADIYFEYKNDKRHHRLDEVLKLRENDWFSKGVALSPECNKHTVEASIQCMRELRDGGAVRHQIIAAACSIDHAKAIRSLYQERELHAEVIHSKLVEEEQNRIRAALERGELDVIVQVQMLGEGADYPRLGVAAIFRPYRHLVPYVQFVGRVMRVAKQDAPGDPDNRAFVVAHTGLNVDRWWDELRQLDKNDQMFFEELANGTRDFAEGNSNSDPSPRRRFTPSMRVLDETIKHFIEERFLPEDAQVVVDDLIHALRIRGVEFEELGVSREDLARRLVSAQQAKETKGQIQTSMVQPQVERQESRRRLDERVRAGAKQLLNELGLTATGFELPRLFPNTGATNNLAAAIILLNKEVQRFLGAETDSRSDMSVPQLRSAHDSMDRLIDEVAAAYRKKRKS